MDIVGEGKHDLDRYQHEQQYTIYTLKIGEKTRRRSEAWHSQGFPVRSISVRYVFPYKVAVSYFAAKAALVLDVLRQFDDTLASDSIH